MRQRSIDLRRLRNPDEAEDGDGEAHGEAAAPAPASASTATADSIEEKPPHVAITISVEATDNSSGGPVVVPLDKSAFERLERKAANDRRRPKLAPL